MIEAARVGIVFARKGHAPVRALHDVTLRAPAGEVTGLLGPNGSGKSTFFRLAAGLLPCREGRLRVAGHDVARHPQRARASLGLLTEEPGLPRRSTPLWHLTLHGVLHGMDPGPARVRALELLAEMDLMPDAGRPCAELSRGSRLRVALARALVHRPAVLLLDEPTATLDIAAAASLRARLTALARAGRTVLLASHNPHEAEALCSWIHLLCRGRIVAVGSPADLRRVTGTPTLERACLALLEAP